jgi:hypothetical protein
MQTTDYWLNELLKLIGCDNPDEVIKNNPDQIILMKNFLEKIQNDAINN